MKASQAMLALLRIVVRGYPTLKVIDGLTPRAFFIGKGALGLPYPNLRTVLALEDRGLLRRTDVEAGLPGYVMEATEAGRALVACKNCQGFGYQGDPEEAGPLWACPVCQGDGISKVLRCTSPA